MTKGDFVKIKLVKEQVNYLDKKLSKDFGDTLNQKVEQLIKEACQRAENNGRTVVMAKDL